MTRDEFEAVAREAVRGLPDSIRKHLVNVVFAIEPESTTRQLGEHGDELLGLYEGVPYPDKSSSGTLVPDRITLFQGPLERTSDSHADLIRNIQDTILHEVGHYLGLDDEELEDYGL